jgi:choloylglycine hydrolase
MCTSFRVIADDASVIVGRTMEFPTLMDAGLVVIPRGFEMHSYAPNSRQGRRWTARYGAVGVDAFPQADAEAGGYTWTDGVNEAGVYVGMLYHPGFCQFGSPDGIPAEQLMSAAHFAALVLTTCATVDEAKAVLQGVSFWPWQPPGISVQLMCHFAIHDAGGHAVVVEWDSGRMRVFDDPLGVLTNAPGFDWHLINLRNYVNLRTADVSAVTIEGVELAPLGVGAGMRGLPGDSTPTARFVRAVAYAAAATRQPDGAAAENMALHIVNNFDIPDGLVIESVDPPIEGQTLWSSIANLAERSYSVRMQHDHTFRKVYLADLDLDADRLRTMPLPAAHGFPPLEVG